MVRRASAACHGKASCFLSIESSHPSRRPEAKELERKADSQLCWLQQVAVCFGGRGLAGLFLHMARTGVYAGMPGK